MPNLSFFRAKLTEILSLNGIASFDDFTFRRNQTGFPQLEIAVPEYNDSLLTANGWYVRRTKSDDIKAFQLNLDQTISKIKDNMVIRGLLKTDDKPIPDI